jgi:predicted nucleotidyltransferase
MFLVTPAARTFVPRSPRGERLAARRDEVITVAREAGYVNVKVFGSVARGDDDEDSDIDLMVTPVETYSLFPLMGLGIELGELLGEHVDMVPEPKLRPSLSSSALRDAVPL